MKFQPGTVAVLDLSPILDRVLVYTNSLNRYDFAEMRQYLCEEVGPKSSMWVTLTTSASRIANKRSVVVTTPGDGARCVNDPWTRIQIPNRLFRVAHRPAVVGPRLAVDHPSVLRGLVEFRANNPNPFGGQVCRRACDVSDRADSARRGMTGGEVP